MPCSPASVSILYPCDLTAAEWTQLAPLLPAPARRGRPRRWSLRWLVNALFYVLRTGCAWRYLPREYPPWQTTYTTFRQWRLHGVWQRVHEGGKQIKGRKRHLLVDTLGLLLSVSVTPANTSDQEGARRLLGGLKPLQPRLELIWADSAYRGAPLATWWAAEGAGGWPSSHRRPPCRGLSSDRGVGLWNARWGGWGGSAASVRIRSARCRRVKPC